ncbi:hypothetical protein KCP70_08005 [Salmonella enterica subsp. enterica]|nr:hypothetical protein KCP70_08005 [Salmonella enterica subsp. enterica]
MLARHGSRKNHYYRVKIRVFPAICWSPRWRRPAAAGLSARLMRTYANAAVAYLTRTFRARRYRYLGFA